METKPDFQVDYDRHKQQLYVAAQTLIRNDVTRILEEKNKFYKVLKEQEQLDQITY